MPTKQHLRRRISHEALLYEDSSSSDEEDAKQQQATQKQAIQEINTRYLFSNKHCFNAFESIVTELWMTSIYICLVSCIALILTMCVIGSHDKYFTLCFYGFALSIIIGCACIYFYKMYEKRISNNPVSDYIVYDKDMDLFQIYISAPEQVCGCFRLRNGSKLLWQCSLSALQRCEYLQDIRVMVLYFYDPIHDNDEMTQFKELFFVHKEWEKYINSKLTQCKFDWNIQTRTA